jgi:hypothetical protein
MSLSSHCRRHVAFDIIGKIVIFLLNIDLMFTPIEFARHYCTSDVLVASDWNDTLRLESLAAELGLFWLLVFSAKAGVAGARPFC